MRGKTNFFERIRELAGRGGLSHAWLLSGPDAVETDKAALFLASALLCDGRASVPPCGGCIHCRKAARGTHPDLLKVERLPEKRELRVDQIRDMIAEAYILPNEAERKVFIIEEAELLNTSAQNAMLKLLEEPPSYAAFILKASNPGALLPTVRSRCAELYVASEIETREHSELSYELASALAAGDGVRLVRACASAEKLDKEAFDKLIDELYAVSGEMAKQASSPEIMARFIELSALAERLREMRGFNVSAGHCLGLIMSCL